jgi:hypothetical protein
MVLYRGWSSALVENSQTELLNGQRGGYDYFDMLGVKVAPDCLEETFHYASYGSGGLIGRDRDVRAREETAAGRAVRDEFGKPDGAIAQRVTVDRDSC